MSKREPPKDTRFKPGKSGNPNGRPAGSRSKVLVALDTLAEGEATAIVTAMIEKAKDGDAVAGRTILERVWPPRKGARLASNCPMPMVPRIFRTRSARSTVRSPMVLSRLTRAR